MAYTGNYKNKNFSFACPTFPWAIWLLCLASGVYANTGPIAKFSFNRGKDYDEVSSKKVKLVGTSFTTDRFGNENNAVFLSGNRSSYINLGNYGALKPKTGSISLWAKMEHPIWSGTGVLVNPIIITKYTTLSDFYESYAIYYMLETKRIAGVCVYDSTQEVGIFSQGEFERNGWQHLVLTYDTNYLCFYMNNQLEGRLAKKFETRFLATDSVMIGCSANDKNMRFFQGSVDDVEFYDRVLSPAEINGLYRADNPNKNAIILNWIMAAVGFLLIGFILYLLVKYQIKKGVLKEKKRFELYNLVLETELRVNRALMNPHFIFNSLNTLQSFILRQENETANDYLVKFSKLIRKILESNSSGIILLELEIDLLKKYLEIENLRFEKNIAYTINIDPAVIPSSINIPIMMLQPFLENAIWHGLLNKAGDKQLHVSFTLLDKLYLKCVIDDNGIGRKKSEQASTEKKSMAISFISQRLNLINKIHTLNCTLSVEDKGNGQGTTVTIILPILNK